MAYLKLVAMVLVLSPLYAMAFMTYPLSTLRNRPTCRSCRQSSTTLHMMAKPLQLEADASFDDIVLKSDVPVLVDFHASWCAPCKLLAPVMDQLAEAYDGTLKVVKVDCDTHKDLMNFYRARGLPMMAVFNGGELLKRKEGLLDFDEVGAMLAKLVLDFKTMPEP